MTTKIIAKDDVQRPVVASGVIHHTDYMPDGVTRVASGNGTRNLDLAALPAGAIVTAGGLVVLEGWLGPQTNSVDLGDSDPTDVDLDRYTPTPLTIVSIPSIRSITPTGYVTVDPCMFTMEWVNDGGGGSILGNLIWWVEYIVVDRAHYAYG